MFLRIEKLSAMLLDSTVRVHFGLTPFSGHVLNKVKLLTA